MEKSRVLKVSKPVHERSSRRHRQAIVSSFVILLSVIACVVPGLAEPTPTPTTVPPPTATLPLPSPTIEPTPVPATLTTSETVSCLAGPDAAFETVSTLLAGEKVEVVGKSAGYWVVKTIDGSVCWVADQGVAVEGDLATIPDAEAPPAPAPAAPAAPQNIVSTYQSCTRDPASKSIRYIVTFHLTWSDMSNNEDGFRVYRDGNLVAEMSADKTELVDEFNFKNIKTHFYSVAAYNAVGESKSDVVALICSGGGGGGGGAPGPGPGG